MPTSRPKSQTAYRLRRKDQGFRRLVVRVRKDDAALVRSVVSALADLERGAETRTLLRERFGGRPPIGLKALLAAAPLEGIDLDRT